MKVTVKYLIGSRAFFDGLEGFEPKDYDELCIVDDFRLRGNVIRVPLHGKDVFFYRNMDKDGFIRDALESNVPMRVGKFLVPKFAEHLGLAVSDLRSLEPLFDALDEKHEYERLIYDAYIANGAFVLTADQRQEAYENYKSRR